MSTKRMLKSYVRRGFKMNKKKHIVVDEETHRLVKRTAFLNDMQIGDLVKKLIKEYLDRDEAKKATQ